MDEIIFFHALGREHIRQIIDIQLAALRRAARGPEAPARAVRPRRGTLIIEEGYDPVYGARPLKRTLQRRLLDPLALAVLEGDFARAIPSRSTPATARWC